MGCWGSSCHGCAGSMSSGIWYNESAVITMPAVGTAKLEDDEKQSANITVELPAGAKLYVDGNLVTGDDTVRHFHTPTLTRGKQYYYTMKAEVTVAGKPVTEEKQILVRGRPGDGKVREAVGGRESRDGWFGLLVLIGS